MQILLETRATMCMANDGNWLMQSIADMEIFKYTLFSLPGQTRVADKSGECRPNETTFGLKFLTQAHLCICGLILDGPCWKKQFTEGLQRAVLKFLQYLSADLASAGRKPLTFTRKIHSRYCVNLDRWVFRMLKKNTSSNAFQVCLNSPRVMRVSRC